MRIERWVGIVGLITVSAVLAAQTATYSAANPASQTERQKRSPHGLSRSYDKVVQAMVSGQNSDDAKGLAEETNLLEKSREAGLLTDWHLTGRFGHGSSDEFAHKFAPEREAVKQVLKGIAQRRYELVFPGGTFTLPDEMAKLKGVFYASSSAYLAGGGDWNVYLESGAETVVFVDGRRILTHGSSETGVLRGKIHVESGYHSIMVKFIAQAAPFRVAILPLNSGSKRKNNTPYLQAAPASENMLAVGRGRESPTTTRPTGSANRAGQPGE